MSIVSSFSPRALFNPIEEVIPSLQESVPGHVTMSRIVSRALFANPIAFKAR